MAVYQVAFVFESDSDRYAQVVANDLVKAISNMEEKGFAGSSKVAFTKFEQEAPEVASE